MSDNKSLQDDWNDPDCQCSLCGNEHHTRSSYEAADAAARENVPSWDVLNASLVEAFARSTSEQPTQPSRSRIMAAQLLISLLEEDGELVEETLRRMAAGK